MSEIIRLACIDSEAPPLFNASADGVSRTGYEPDAARLIFDRLGYEIEWVMVAWDDMIPAVRRHDADAVWCGQGMTADRAALVDFTGAYAVFNETLIVRADDPARAPQDLVGYRIAAIENSTNMKLATTFPGVEIVSFGASDDVFGDMIKATRDGSVDGFVDDDVVMFPLAETDDDLAIAFTVPTRNRWGVGVAPGNQSLRDAIDGALTESIEDGSLEAVWKRWMPLLDFPLQKSTSSK